LKSGSGDLSISLPAGETDFFINAGTNTSYSINMSLDNNVYCFFNGSPRGKIAFLDDHGKNSYDPRYFPSYVYIPDNTTEVQYRIKQDALKIIDPAGNVVPTKLVKALTGGVQLRSFTVPAGSTRKFWQAII